MTTLGQASLLIAFAASGYSAFACIAGVRAEREGLVRFGRWAGLLSVLALTVSLVVLARALYCRDFRFLYVQQYSSRLLPWYYSLAALWVGQAGSLLLWSWMLGGLSVGFVLGSRPRGGSLDHDSSDSKRRTDRVNGRAFGLLMGYLCFLTATMVFAADPMAPSVDRSGEGAGLSPLLQHPAMLIHPPVVFLAYAGWAIPCALMLSALTEGTLPQRSLQRMRWWGLMSWALLATGILLGAQWSYEELGWGGYWAWDPVENASLIPWLTGTAFLHTLMAWRSRGVLRKCSAALAVATFGLCNLASFLTRSGIFSSLHAFSRSPIGWLFLGLMLGLAVAGAALIVSRRGMLTPERPMTSLLSCEALVLVSTTALVLLAALVTAGTVLVAVSEFLVGRRIEVGPPFYNRALIASGMVLLGAIAPAPLLQWGGAPSKPRRQALIGSLAVAVVGIAVSLASGVRPALALICGGILPAAVCALACRLALDMRHRRPNPLLARLVGALRDGRRTYAGFFAHLGLVGLTIGVTGSSLGLVQGDFEIVEGESVRWAGRSIRFSHLNRDSFPDKLVVTATLQVTDETGTEATLRPAQHYHKLQETWTTEAAVLSRLSEDLYAVVHHGEGNRARFVVRSIPLMSCLWGGGWLMGLAALLGLIPDRVPRARPALQGISADVASRRATRPSGTAARQPERTATGATVSSRGIR